MKLRLLHLLQKITKSLGKGKQGNRADKREDEVKILITNTKEILLPCLLQAR